MKENNIYNMAQWQKDGSLSVKVGQLIDREVFEQLLNCVPPKTYGRGLFQVGEPRNHDFAMRPLFDTFENTADGWRFCGKCLEGSTVNRLGWGDVEAERILPVEFEGIDDHNRPIFKIIDGRKKWRFGCCCNLFRLDATEAEVCEKFQEIGDGIRSDFYYFGNKFGCEPAGDPLYDGDKVVIYWYNSNQTF